MDSYTQDSPKHFLNSHKLKNTTIDLTELENISSSDLELFLSIFLLTQKYYNKYTNNLNRIKATIQIVKELEVASHKKTLNIISWNKTDEQIPFRP